MQAKFYFLNGEIVDSKAVKISPYDIGFSRGYGIFDAMRTVNGIPFCADKHWEKFSASAKELDLELPVTEGEFKNILESLFAKNNFKEASIKTILTGGESENGFAKMGKPTFLILMDDFDLFKVSPESYITGWKLITVEFQRYLPEIKTINYLAAIKNQKKKKESDAQEILYVNKGNILECSTSNLFLIKDNEIITAKNNVFLGTVRNLVIELARKNNFSVNERDIATEELFSADEVFLTATYKKIVPIINVDGLTVGGGRVGDNSKKLMNLLDDFMKNYQQN